MNPFKVGDRVRRTADQPTYVTEQGTVTYVTNQTVCVDHGLGWCSWRFELVSPAPESAPEPDALDVLKQVVDALTPLKDTERRAVYAYIGKRFTLG